MIVTMCLWYDSSAEEAVRFYTEVLEDAQLGAITHYPEGSYGGRDGQVMTVEFTIAGQRFVALNGGPEFTLSEAASIQLEVDTQEEIDRLWDALVAGGGEHSVCGWLKDRYGLSWQVSPKILGPLYQDADPAVAKRVNAAMLQMTKLDIAAVEAAARGD